MHPEIKLFFERINRVSGPFSDRSNDYNVYYLKKRRDPFADEIAHEYKDEIVYFWKDKEYSEQELLKIIKMISFV